MNAANMITNANESLTDIYDYDYEDVDPVYMNFEFVVEGVLLSVVAFLGIIGNMLSLFILLRSDMRTPLNCMLQGLAVFDTLLLVSSVLLFGLYAMGQQIRFLGHYVTNVRPIVLPVVYPIMVITETGSIWTIMGVSVERYLATCHPVKAQSLNTCCYSRLFTLLIAVFAICYGMPSFWKYEQIEFIHPLLNTTHYYHQESQFALEHPFRGVYEQWMHLVVLHVIPYITLAVLNLLIWRKVKSVEVVGPGLHRLQESEISLAKMLICVVAVFFLCHTVAFVANILRHFEINVPYVVSTSNFLITTNSAVNFIIYCVFRKKFRMIFLDIFCKSQVKAVHSSRRSRTDSSVDFAENDTSTSIKLQMNETSL